MKMYLSTRDTRFLGFRIFCEIAAADGINRAEKEILNDQGASEAEV